MKIESIISQFDIKGRFVGCTPFGEGHINSTFLVLLEDNHSITEYILQRMHPVAFHNIPKLIENIQKVTSYIADKLASEGKDASRSTLTLIPTKSGEYYSHENGEYYRVYTYIRGSVAYQTVEHPWQFRECGLAFGRFANLLSAFHAEELYETIPHFHDTEKRFANLKASIEKDTCQRAAEVEDEIRFALDHSHLASKITSKLRTGEIPTKVTHNDTKLNNVLFDADTGHSLAVIDLDTVMAGSICYDFGDAIRFGCNTVAEDETNLSLLDFSMPLFKLFTEGYLQGLGRNVTPAEIANLAMGALVMTYECGMRFLTDYLDGDVYFRVAHPRHNLDRCRTQFALLRKMEERYEEMVDVVMSCAKI